MQHAVRVVFALVGLSACHARPPDPGGDDDDPPGAAQLGITDGAGGVIAELGFAGDDSAALRIANLGSAASKPLAIAITGEGRDDFAIDPASSCASVVLAPAQTCTVMVMYQPAGDAPRTATLAIADDAGHRAEVALRPVARPRLVIAFAGGGAGEVRVADATTGDVLTTCTRRCSLRLTEGRAIELVAATPSIYRGLSGACTTSEPSCAVEIGRGASTVTATFATDPKEQWTVLPGGAPIASAAFDGAGDLIVASNGITKLSRSGAQLWRIALGACAVATGPGNTIYAETATAVVKLAPDGTTIWSAPLVPHAVGCGGGEGFVHNLAVGADGAVAIHGNTGVARWDGDGHLSWSAAVDALGEHGVAIEPDGVVDVAVLTDEPIDLVRFAADGTPLDRIEHITSQYHGMFVVDATGRLLAAASGHSHTDAFGHSVDLFDPDYAPTGICAAGAGDVAWVYHAADDSFFARDWTVNRYRADRSLLWTYSSFIQRRDFDELGTIPLDIAGAPDGRIALVGSFSGATYQGGWIATFAP